MEERKFYRSTQDRMVAGVCGGIAEYFGMDPSLVRLLTVILAIVGNAAIVIVYILLWIIVPEQPAEETLGHVGPTLDVPVAAATAGPAYAAYAVDATSSPSSPPEPEPAPPRPEPPVTTAPVEPAPPAPVMQPATPQQPVEHHGIRSGLIWFGILLIVLGGALLVDRMFPDLSLWGFWPGTLIGVLFIVSGIRTMVTKEGDD